MKHNLSEDILCLLEQHLISNGKSPKTISTYLFSVKAYIGWFQDRFQKVPQQLFVENVADYKVFLQQREIAPSTFNSQMAGLRSWNEYLIQTGKQISNCFFIGQGGSITERLPKTRKIQVSTIGS